MFITVLCKVVDNYGDIGVVWRLCNQLKKIDKNNKINLIVDDLISFKNICHSINPNKSIQKYNNIFIYNWNCNQICTDSFIKNDGEKLAIILECFQCGRPDWLEDILFNKKLNRTVNIIMIDYLTAEKYAEDFHCLQSLTRSSKVKKVNFMPGFTNKTGGLVIDKKWKTQKIYKNNGPVLFFTYEKDWTNLVCAYSKSVLNQKKILLAQGRGRESLLQAFNSFNIKNIKYLKFLNQSKWDTMMQQCSTLIIRGEESMSRACLSGIPFIWHAYPQSDEYQLVKVNALLDRMQCHFKKEDFEIIKNAWININSPESLEKPFLDFFNNCEFFVYGFRDFANSLRKNGDQALNLMTFIKKTIIMEE